MSSQRYTPEFKGEAVPQVVERITTTLVIDMRFTLLRNEQWCVTHAQADKEFMQLTGLLTTLPGTCTTGEQGKSAG
jgi:hypothetical protein